MKSSCTYIKMLGPHSSQVVPDIPNLYKSSFTYHTVSSKPPDFQECALFLGAPLNPLLHKSQVKESPLVSKDYALPSQKLLAIFL